MAVISRGLMVLLIGTLVVGCGDRGGETSAQPPPDTTRNSLIDARMIHAPSVIRDRLRIGAVTLRELPTVVTAPGEVALDLRKMAKITSRIEGQIEEIHARLGDHVKENQPLAAIGGLQLDQLIEEYLVARAQAEVAENSFRRTEKLRAADVVPERKLIEDRGKYLETKARHQHMREKLLRMGLSTTELTNLERGGHQEGHRYILTAPITGTVVMQRAVLGQGVAPGHELFEIVDTSTVWVFANLPIEEARRFKEGDTGTIIPKGGAPITAPLTYIAPVADATTRTIRVRFEVSNERAYVKPGEYVDVQLSHSGAPILAVPASAVTIVDDQHGVFVSSETGYAFTPIETGRKGDGWVEVNKGLTDSDQVVIEGVFDLKTLLLKEHIESGEGG